MIRTAENPQGQISGVSQCQKCHWSIYLQWTFLRRGSIDPIEIYNPKDVGVDKCSSWSFWRDSRYYGRKRFPPSPLLPSSSPLRVPKGTEKWRQSDRKKTIYKNMEMQDCLTDIWLRASHVNPSIWFSILKRSCFLDWKQIKVSLTYSRKPFIFNII